MFGALGTTDEYWGNVNANDLISISGHLSKHPEISGGNNRNNPIKLNIRLKEIPNINFCNSGIFYDATNSHEIVNAFQIDDSINLFILKEEYHKKILKDANRTIFEKFSDPVDRIDMYGILSDDLNYVQLAKINNAFGQKKTFARPFAWLVVLVLITLGIVKIFR